MYQDKKSLEDFFRIFLEKEGSSLKTQKNYVTDLRDFFTFIEGAKMGSSSFSSDEIANVSHSDIQHYKNYLVGLQKSDSTIQRRLSSLRTFFRACEGAGFVKTTPFPQVKEEIKFHPLVHVWQGHLRENGLPLRMSEDVQDFLLWIHEKKKH